MMPNYFIPLVSFPLDINGKLDRKALPDPTQALYFSGAVYVAPSTPMEKKLVEIWREVLKCDSIGIYDNFFAIGGHSLLAMMIINRIAQTYSVYLPIIIVFKMPTIAKLALHIEEYTKHSINHSQQERDILPANSLHILPKNPREFVPLSFAQERLWFLELYEQGKAVAYNISEVLSLKGNLNIEKLLASLENILIRHKSLITIFEQKDGKPYQVISENTKFDMSFQDLTNNDKKESEIDRFYAQEINKAFDIQKGPLIRGNLLKTASNEYVLLLTLHHIICDGWSIGIFYRELSEYYNAQIMEKKLELPSLSVQYTDFAVMQREWLQGEVLLRQGAYWKKRLADYEDLNLPTDYPRPALQTFNGNHHSFQLSLKLTQSLKNLARGCHASIFTVLLTAFNVLLSRYSGQNDIVIGVPIANRSCSKTEELIGFFVNILPLRTQIHPNQTFKDLIHEVTDHAFQAYQHQDIPFEKIVDILQVKRDLSRSPLFQVMFVLQNATTVAELTPQLSGLEVSRLKQPYTKSKFDLTLEIWEEPLGLWGNIEFNTDLFTDKKIMALIEHYQLLLANIIYNPNQYVIGINFLDKAEYYNLLYINNKTDYQGDKNNLIHVLFESRARTSPQSTALLYKDTHITYAELNTKANKLAYYLIELGVSPDTLVAICMNRSIELIIAMLAILKAGGAYVPIDPDYPESRIHSIVKDTCTRIIITQNVLKETFHELGSKIICIDESLSNIPASNSSNPNIKMTPENLAYVIYTSGSTGKPKGVMCKHSSVCCCVEELQQYLHLDKKDKVLQHISISFDVSVEEIFHPLLFGSCVIISPARSQKDPRELMDIAFINKATIIHLVPSMLKAILETVESTKLIYFKKVIMGGEPLMADLVAEFKTKSNAELLNGYGPTEAFYTSLWSCNERTTTKSIPIGKPIGDTRMYVLDKYMQVVPDGISGELYISGSHLARGYHNCPELTAEKFIPNSFDSSPGALLYRTGDLVRWLPDGNLDFLGRLDHQIKIRGYRIEVGEIETALRKHPDIKDAAVIAREDQPDNKLLVAYYTLKVKSEIVLTVNTLINYLEKYLPDYMIPSFFVPLPSFPLSPNGKLDRKGLPKPDKDLIALEIEFVAPRNLLEQKLADVWCEVLKVKSIGMYDNFFMVGGHSLLAMRVISRISQIYGVNLPIKNIFKTPTIAELCCTIKSEFDRLWENYASPLALAAGNNKKTIVYSLLKRGVAIDSEDCYGRTALSIAITEGHEEVVKMLLEFGSNVNKARKDGTTPLMSAEEKGNNNIIKMLLTKLEEKNDFILSEC